MKNITLLVLSFVSIVFGSERVFAQGECRIAINRCPTNPQWESYRLWQATGDWNIFTKGFVDAAGSASVKACSLSAARYHTWCEAAYTVRYTYRVPAATYRGYSDTTGYVANRQYCRVLLQDCPNHPDLTVGREFNDTWSSFDPAKNLYTDT